MKSRFRISISVKLISVTICLLAVTTFILAHESANRFESISVEAQKQASLDQSKAIASEVESLFLTYIDKAKVIASLMLKDTSSADEKAKSLNLIFGHDKDFIAIEVLGKSKDADPLRVVNESYIQQQDKSLNKTFIDEVRSAQYMKKIVFFENLFSGKEGHIEVRNSTINAKVPMLSIGFPLAKDEYGIVTHIVIADVRMERLQKLFSAINKSSLYKMYLVDDLGNLLAHKVEQKVINRESLSKHPVVQKALASELKQGQMNFTDSSTNESFVAAYSKTAFGNAIIATGSNATILEKAHLMKREAYYIAGRILSVALFLIFIFSITLTTPLENLAELTTQVAKGDFNVRASLHSRDEVGQLAEAFNQMIEGLVERDKVKSMFNKFHGFSVTEDLLKGDLKLGGSKKTVIVFFSDVRDFTKFSEGHTPEEVVSMLNEYFQVMVSIINKNGGLVDKFIGDAIMAVWGAPNSSESDPQNAVRACLEMRSALESLNHLRESRGQVALKIGIGLHRGEAISGTVGSSERMEYTVIGDTVNQASRIEASTKAFGTDFLMSDSLADFVKNDFIVEQAGQVEVKGKSEPLTLYKTLGYYDSDKNPVFIKTAFSDYEAEAVDKVKIAS